MAHAAHSGGAAAHHAALLQAIQSMGVIVQVKPSIFLALVQKNDISLVLKATGGFMRRHHRYLTTYKGLTFFTKVYEPLALPSTSEIVEVGKLHIPYEAWTIWHARE